MTRPRHLAAPLVGAILAVTPAMAGDARVFVDDIRLQSDLAGLAKCELFLGALEARGRQMAFLLKANARVRLTIRTTASPESSKTQTVSYTLTNLFDPRERRRCARLVGPKAGLGIRQWIDDATRIAVTGSHASDIVAYSAKLYAPETGPIVARRMLRGDLGTTSRHAVEAELEVVVGASLRRSGLAWPTSRATERKA